MKKDYFMDTNDKGNAPSSSEKPKNKKPQYHNRFQRNTDNTKTQLNKQPKQIQEKPQNANIAIVQHQNEIKKDTRKEVFNKNQPKEKQGGQMLLSVVVPLYNEEESLPELSLLLEEELNKIAKNRWEVIFVDDGSTDGSYQQIKAINNRNRNFHAIRFRRNFGKAAALTAGFGAAKGLIVVTMDADLQDDPTEIAPLISKLKEGFDLVTGWKKKRHDPITKTLPSKVINKITSIMTGMKLHDMNCGLKAYRSEVTKSLNIYGEIYRYIPALAKWEGFRVTELPVKHHKRRYGKSKFGFSRFIKGFLDLITVMFTTRYLKRPLHFFGTIGSLFALVGLGLDIYLVIEWILGETYLSNRPLALFGIALIIVGVQLFSFGLVGEMITKRSTDKQSFNIKERI